MLLGLSHVFCPQSTNAYISKSQASLDTNKNTLFFPHSVTISSCHFHNCIVSQTRKVFVLRTWLSSSTLLCCRDTAMPEAKQTMMESSFNPERDTQDSYHLKVTRRENSMGNNCLGDKTASPFGTLDQEPFMKSYWAPAVRPIENNDALTGRINKKTTAYENVFVSE